MAGHGGRREGSGRKPKVIPRDVARVGKRELLPSLNRLPSTPLGIRRRSALVMSAYGAPDTDIALALGIEDLDSVADEIAAGRAMTQGALIDATWAAAEMGDSRSILWLLRKTEAECARADAAKAAAKAARKRKKAPKITHMPPANWVL